MKNTGDCSTGDCSTGDRSTGNRSTGDRSTGNRSTGHRSTGHCSTGNRSTGHCSTGHWSISSHSSGHFSTEDYSGFGCFDNPCTLEEWQNAYNPMFLYFDLTEFIPQENMSKEDKKDNPEYKTAEGYLKVYGYKEAFKKSWDNADKKDRERIKDLPNFDAKKFEEISSINVNEATSLSGKEVSVTIDNKTYTAIIK